MALRRYVLTREQRAEVYIDCDDFNEAADGAWELVQPRDWEDEWTDTEIEKCKSSQGRPVWVGGGDGDWGPPAEDPS